MQSFNVNLQNKRLSINGIFAGAETNKTSACTTAYTGDNTGKQKNDMHGINTTHTTLTWLTNKHVVLADKHQNKHQNRLGSKDSKEEMQAKTGDIEHLCLGIRQDSAQLTTCRQNVSVFYLAMITLHTAAFALSILMLAINKQEKLFFGASLHMAIVIFAPMHVAFATSRKNKALLLFLHLCGLYALVDEGFSAKVTGSSVYVFCITLLLVQVVWHTQKYACKAEVRILYYCMHILAIFAVIGLWVLRRAYVDKQATQQEEIEDALDTDYAFLFDVTALLTTAMLFACSKLL